MASCCKPLRNSGIQAHRFLSLLQSAVQQGLTLSCATVVICAAATKRKRWLREPFRLGIGREQSRKFCILAGSHNAPVELCAIGLVAQGL